MSTADDALELGANLSLVLMLMTIVLCSARMLSDTNLKINSLNVKAVYDKVNCFSPYENHTVSGDKVRQFVDLYSDSLFIRVSTVNRPEGIYGSALADMRDIEHENCIAQTGEFHCTLLRDENNEVIGANFEQIGAVLDITKMQETITACDQELSNLSGEGVIVSPP